MTSTTATASLPPYMLPGVVVTQPPHLEGDAKLSTEILAGPPTVASIQQSIQKRDPRKPTLVYSYLPASDPGSTYSGFMHGAVVGDALTKRSSRTGRGTATGRAQRASARSQLGPSSAAAPPVVHALPSSFQLTVPNDPESPIIIDDDPALSRSTSVQNFMEASSSSTNGRSKKRDKGKGKEIDGRIKEEPRAESLRTPEPFTVQIPNEDHCSSCRSTGSLVYCDGCPRAFHLWCLDPPLESADVSDRNKWYCPACMIRKQPPRKPPPSLLAPLIHSVQIQIPTEFQLPEDIRNTFKDVTTDSKGAYVDSSEIKPPRLNRHGQLEERDAHRLRDRNGQPVLCFRCGTSALPADTAAPAPSAKRARRSTAKAVQYYEQWKNIVSCDYCDLHWHLDCLEPPLPSMPPLNKKWMCPNHVEQIMPSKKRIPKHNAPPLEITKPDQFNNGNIEITHPIAEYSASSQPKVAMEEVLINGRRYRVPERVILLDFWNKISKPQQQIPGPSTAPSGTISEDDEMTPLSSPLTSLSSLDDEPLNDGPDEKDLCLAEMLCDLRMNVIKSQSDAAPVHVLPPSNKKPKSTNNISRPSAQVSSSAGPNKRRKATHTPASDPADKALRSKPQTNDSRVASGKPGDDAISVDNFISVPSKSKVIRVKTEEGDSVANGLTGKAPRRSTARVIRRAKSDTFDVEEEDFEKVDKRNKKRKQRDDEMAYVDYATERAIKTKKVLKSPMSRRGKKAGDDASSGPGPSASVSTPLKIRLKLPASMTFTHSSSSTSHAAANGDTHNHL